MKQIPPRSNYSGTKSRTKNLHESLTLAQRGCSFGRWSALQHIGCYLKVEMCVAHGLKVLTGSFNLSKCSCSQRLLAGNPSYPCQKKTNIMLEGCIWIHRCKILVFVMSLKRAPPCPEQQLAARPEGWPKFEKKLQWSLSKAEAFPSSACACMVIACWQKLWHLMPPCGGARLKSILQHGPGWLPMGTSLERFSTKGVAAKSCGLGTLS